MCEHFLKKKRKVIFGQLLAMFLKSQSYSFDAIAHTGAPLGVE